MLKSTHATPIHVTSCFIICGLLAVVCILEGRPFLAAVLLVLKSILDAADGELARLKNTPSYVGRYYDSIADLLLNFLFLLTFWHTGDHSILLMLLAFIGLQLQGTVYNYYYVILRNRVAGDSTSRVFEDEVPVAFRGERQKTVTLFYRVYQLLYLPFDRVVRWLDRGAVNSRPFPKWFMSLISVFGLGFQLLLMAGMLVLGLEHYALLFFTGFSMLILVFVGIRRTMLS